ncbi:hypothetical protein SLEP1_g41295 [Rubroshorea leprosula]|uniref:Reverse transcriptase domain-containing protein n=1 Tax=Rubroshorea leprosula TaxID=152421 RepID=A0AAV5L645_9ROSI|nr:hypothetical protein SLEP1_g41295 [Rubroshorea leprosula]
MKILSFNVRGLGGILKKKEVGKLVKAERPDFLFLQETKLEKADGNLCRMLWNSDGFDWVMKGSSGASGGMVCVWDKLQFTKKEEFVGDGFLGVVGEWGVSKLQCYFVNVYASNDKRKKVEVWEELQKVIIEKGGRWLLAGDFNAVRYLEEKRGRTGENVEMRDFNAFIETTGLVDIRLANRRFTWYRSDGSSMSRLDRVLMTEEMFNMGGEWVQHGLRRTISDHCAIIIKTKITDWGPKPFRVLDAWQQHLEFKNVVEDKWKELQVEGFAGYRCKQKLKMLKEFLKGWNCEVFGDMEAQFNNAAKKVEHVDMKNEEGVLEDFELEERQEGFQEMWAVMRKREAIWRQKARSNWVQLGDANTRFFHRMANGRRAQNSISGLMCDGRWVEEPTLVKKEVETYFRKLFQGEDWKRPRPAGIQFKQISTERKEWLERPFSEEEIEEALRSCEGTKAPGPDGLVGGLNSSFLTLIPKKLSPTELKDYKPISLIGCVYKLLAKVISHRLKTVMPEIISDTQSAFLGGRQPVDSVLVLNEVVDEVKKMKRQAFVFKADFEKAYDCVDWEFLDWMMGSFGFGDKWRGWIKECLSTARLSILVNGSPTEEFKMGKGLRQGDPLSPFLFLMIGEGLHGLVNKAETVELKRKISWVNWESVCCSRMTGGLGVPDLRRRNWALLGKWWARLGGMSASLRNLLVKGFRWELGDGKRVGFWREIWVGDKSLRDLCPRLYELAVKKEGLVSEIGEWEEDRWQWNMEWRRERKGRVRDEEEVLRELMGRFQLKKGKEDHWWWIHGPDGQYEVKVAYEALAPVKCILEDQFCKMIWCRLVPSKVGAAMVGYGGCDSKHNGWSS